MDTGDNEDLGNMLSLSAGEEMLSGDSVLDRTEGHLDFGDGHSFKLSLWVFMCISRLFLVPNVDLQIVHLYTFSPKWAI